MKTIVAIVTPYGYSSVGILRVSGEMVSEIAISILKKIPSPRKGEYLSFFSKEKVIDQGIAIFFKKPNSFTGEDILELQGHGNPIILNELLNQILSHTNVRIARPGEFSQRAFLNGKLDLTQAEAIADLISAKSVQAANLAVQSLKGKFSNLVYKVEKSLTTLRVHIESSIDFIEEENWYISKKKIMFSIIRIIKDLKLILDQSKYSNVINNNIKIVIVGEPNSGKSSLFNSIIGKNSSIVTNIPGTTRDLIKEVIYINGIPIQIIDTAGLCNTFDKVEKIGISYAWKEIKTANHIFLVIDSVICSYENTLKVYLDLINKFPPKVPITIIRSKSDISRETSKLTKLEKFPCVILSSKKNYGIDLLFEHMKNLTVNINNLKGNFLAKNRHISLIKKAILHLNFGKNNLEQKNPNLEVVAEDIKLAYIAIGNITGKSTSENLMKEIFSTFCIGK